MKKGANTFLDTTSYSLGILRRLSNGVTRNTDNLMRIKEKSL